MMMMMFQMSWNTMMEGFRNHEGRTGENPFDMAHKQNEAIKSQLKQVVGENFEERLEQLRKDNEEKERDLERKKKEINDRKQFYEANAPTHVKQKMKNVFNESNKPCEQRFEELDE